MKNIMKLLVFMGAALMQPFLPQARAAETSKTVYDFEFKSLNGEAMPLSAYKGKVLLIVNTASKCGFTGQYEGLEALYERYKDKGLVVIGVPSNDFGEQEPGSAEEIKSFCKLNYGVTFPMAEKQVVTGDGAHPLYYWLNEVLGFGSAPKWNFHKYLIGKDGKPVDFYLSSTTPQSTKLLEAIDREIAK